MESKYNQKDCIGICDIEKCHNTDCPRWNELEEEEMIKEMLEDAFWMHIND